MQTYFNGMAIPMNIFVKREIGFWIFNTLEFYLLAFARQKNKPRKKSHTHGVRESGVISRYKQGIISNWIPMIYTMHSGVKFQKKNPLISNTHIQ